MKSELIYPCDNCINRYNCSDQWHCQNWWNYFYAKKEELKEKSQTKNKRIKAHIVKCPCNNPLTCPFHRGVTYCAWGCFAYVEYRLKVEAAQRANIKYEQKKDKTNYQFSTANGVTFQISMDKNGNFLL